MTGGEVLRTPAEYRGTKGLTAQARRVLDGIVTATIGTADNGVVHMAQVWFLYEDPGLVYFESSSGTKKVRNIVASGHASVLVKGKSGDGGSLLVLGQGDARVLCEENSRAVANRLRAKYIAPAGVEPMGRLLDRIDDIVVELRPRSWVQWSTTQVNTVIQQLPEYEDGSWGEWFLTEDNR